MADKAHRLTDEKLEEMEKRLSAIYSRAEKEIGERWKEYLVESQAEIDELQKAYELAKKGGDAKEIRKAGKKLSNAKRERTLMDKRFKDLTETTAVQLANVNKTALAYVNGQLPDVYSINYNAISQSVDGVGGYTFALVDADTVKNLATTDKSLLPYKQLDEKTDIRWNVKKMNAEVLQGILQGEPMDKIAGRLSKVTEMNETAAIRNARTMVTGAENKGRQDSYKRAEEDGIVMKREWIATNDSRTRHWHAELDGVEVGVDEPWHNEFGEIMFPGDPSADPANTYNCRCSMSANVIGFNKIKVDKDISENSSQEKQNESLAEARRVYGKADGQKYDVVDGDNVELYATGREKNADGTWSEIKRYDLGSVKIPENDNPDLLVVTGLPDKTKFGQFDDTPNYILSDGRIALNPSAKNNNTRQQISSCVENEIYVLSGARRDGHFYRVIGSDKEIEYIKKGTIRKSINHMTGEMEDGLSVWEIPKYGGGKIVELTGDVISIGSDGEPLLDISTVKFVRVVDNSKEMRDIGIEKFKKQYNWTDEQYNQAMRGGYKLNR